MNSLQPKKILIICGPTGTGKTNLGIYLANKFNGEIVSADSRQVYKYLDIGTDKVWDEKGKVKIHGYDLVEPNEDFSVFDFFKFAKSTIKKIWSKNKLPIIVGGTGFYIKSITDEIYTIGIPRNKNLRRQLENLTTEELFEKLAILDSAKAAKFNSSDKKNKRRLIRTIEVAIWYLFNLKKKQKITRKLLPADVCLLKIGLMSQTPFLKDELKRKIEMRMNKGFIEEIEFLLKKGISWKNQSMNAIGYKEAKFFLKKGLSYEEFIENWIRNEMRYVKRQITWFKRDKNINWFNAKDRDLYKKVEKLIEEWYISTINVKKN